MGTSRYAFNDYGAVLRYMMLQKLGTGGFFPVHKILRAGRVIFFENQNYQLLKFVVSTMTRTLENKVKERDCRKMRDFSLPAGSSGDQTTTSLPYASQ